MSLSTGQVVGVSLGVMAVGTAYVLVHEARRKSKKLAREKEEQPIDKETLLKILTKSAEHSKAIIERIRTEVAKLQKQNGFSDEKAMQIFQQNFEHSLDQLIGAIRKQYNVSEKAMDASFKLHQSDPDVQAAIQNMRMLSSQSAATASRTGGGSSAGSSSSAGAGAGGAAVAGVPATLTREKLKEVMAFNATLLEKELKPIKEEMKRQKRAGRQPQADQAALMQLQTRISAQVQQRFGVTDEQVMAAVEKFGAREDPAFKDILQRIANTLNSTLA